MVTKMSRALRRIPTHVADIVLNPRWLPMFALARIVAFRNKAWSRATAPRTVDISNSLFPTVDPDEVVRCLKADGLFEGFQIPTALHTEILNFAKRTPCFGNLNRQIEFLPNNHRSAERSIGRAILTGHFFERVLNCDAARAVQQDPILLQISQSYLGGEARLTATRLWWSFPSELAKEEDLHLASQERLHFDLDDWRLLKFFFYITDVDENAGPHVYVVGSQRRRKLKHQLTLMVGHSTKEIVGFYGRHALKALTGSAGFGFVEDPFGFHMGTIARTSPRLILEVTFGVTEKLHTRFFGEPHPRTSGSWVSVVR